MKIRNKAVPAAYFLLEKDGKILLEKIINQRLLSFCYPYGRYTAKTKEIVRENGFLIARTTRQMSISIHNKSYDLATTVEISPQSLLGIYGQYKESILNRNFLLLPHLRFSWIDNIKKIIRVFNPTNI